MTRVIDLVLVVLGLAGLPVAAETTDDLVFIHHSSGSLWLGNGLHAALLAKDYIDERNDVTYGTVVSPDAGRPTSLGATPGDHTDMNHWILWFNDYLGNVKAHGCADGVNRIVMFKSCFPISSVRSDGTEPGDPFDADQTLVNYKAVYRHPDGAGHTYTNGGYTYKPLEDVFAASPDTLFIPVTAPPLHYAPKDATTDDRAHRARIFNNWLKNEWLAAYNAAHPGLNNVAVFDWFDVLAYPDNHAIHPNRLRAEYGGASGDSHPNDQACVDSTEVFATDGDNFIDEAWAAFSGSHDVGTLSVDTTPVKGEVIVDGVSWGTAPQSRQVAVGQHTVRFGDVAGYATPEDVVVAIVADETSSVAGEYVADASSAPGSLSVDTTPVKGEVIVDGTSWGTAPQSRQIAVGQHTVRFGEVSGYNAPVDQVVTVVGNQTTVVSGTYESSLSVTAGADPDTVAAGGQSTLTATGSGGTPPYTYRWSTGQSGATLVVSPSQTTTYAVTVTDSRGDTAEAQVTVTVPSALSVVIQSGDATGRITPGGSRTLTAGIAGGSGPYTYVWSTGETTDVISVSPASTTTYTVTVTDALGQSADAQYLLEVGYELTVEADGPGEVQQAPEGRSVFAAGEAVTLTAIPAGPCDAFVGWREGDDLIDVEPEMTVTMDSDRTITATFQEGAAEGGACFTTGACQIALTAVAVLLLGRTARGRRAVRRRRST